MNDPIFTSLGMFIIDDNEYPESWNREQEKDIIGGAGTYAIVGARIASGRKYNKQITGIIDQGKDFPHDVINALDNWDTGIKYRYDPARLTTRGLNTYDVDNTRHFRYLSPKKRIELKDIIEQGVIHSKCFHLICSFTRARELVDGIKFHNPTAQFIYEPLPDDCIHENLDKMIQLLSDIDVFTPNLKESCLLLGVPEPSDVGGMRLVANKFVALGSKVFVLRCGPFGCLVGYSEIVEYLPAYHEEQSRVVDVTGGGNSFCGGFMIGYYLTKDPIIGGVFGNIVSGCIIEKLGPPVRDGDLWNGTNVIDRLEMYLNKCDKRILQQYITWL